MGIDSNRPGRFSNINVTPFVDVTLVLLIIFMVVGPMLENDGVEVPRMKDPGVLEDKARQLRISIGADGVVIVGGVILRQEELRSHLDEIRRETPERSIAVRGDRRLDYGDVMSVLRECREAGFLRVGLVAEPSA